MGTGRAIEPGKNIHGKKLFAFTVISSLLLCTFLVSAACASGGGSEDTHAKLINFAWKALDFIVLAGIIYWLVGKKAKDFFAGRREKIGKGLADAASQLEEAQRKFREYEAKLDKATVEIDELTTMIREQGQAEKQRIIKEAHQIAEKIKEDARLRMEQEFKKARHQLRLEAVSYATEMAESLLRENIRVEDHEAMTRNYINNTVKAN
ncbi:MAG: ATP synthase F0 subunit B [Syntrophobacterales bacterium]|nr:ATP synthase F0 subunit B [Syntrophobacterales bacterium]